MVLLFMVFILGSCIGINDKVIEFVEGVVGWRV